MNSITFQCISWYSGDIKDDDSKNIFIIKAFGKTDNDKTISMNIYDYPPHFYIAFNNPTKYICDILKDFVKQQQCEIEDISIVKRKEFYGYTNNESKTFLRLKFKTFWGYKNTMKIFEKRVSIPGINENPIKYKLYESNLEPYLRFMHMKKIKPVGWVSVNGIFEDDILKTYCDYNYGCLWQNICGIEKDIITNFKILSFDIECSSFDGSFPQAIKTYDKLAFEIINTCKYLDKEDIYNEILLAFDLESKGLLNKQNAKTKINIKKFNSKYEDIYNHIIDEDLNYNLADKLSKVLPQLNGDCIIQIGSTVHLYGDQDIYYRNIITLGTCDPIDNADVIECENEIELLMRWRDLILKIDPDVVTGYNIFGFDMEYMVNRSIDLGIKESFLKLSKIKDRVSKYIEKKLSSSALGDNFLKYIDMEGRVLIDVMKVVQRDHKLDYYKLDFVANHFIGLNKNDVTPQEIFKLQKGSSTDRKKIGEYCIVDCALCNKLIIKLETMANNIGMANVCLVPLSYIFMRGQGIKIFSLISKECRDEGFLIPTLKNYEDNNIIDEGYEGAIVLDPKPGIYINDPIAVLDYASLYPSSMISENISHDTIILDSKYDNLPNNEYVSIKYDLYETVDDNKIKIGEKIVRFIQTKDKGVIPKTLMKLLEQRKETRKKMQYKTINGEYSGLYYESENIVSLKDIKGNLLISLNKEEINSVNDTYNKFEKAVLDGLQLAYKVTANSIYGQTGAKTSSIYMKDLAACTTAVGRNMILKAKEFAETKYNAEVIYGDSVVEDTPIILKINDLLYIVDMLFFKSYIWYYCDNGKEYQIHNNIEIWTDAGWSKIKKVIRHYTNKKIFRVKTYKGIVDVTEDHSLVSIEKEYIKPEECKINETKLLHSFPNSLLNTINTNNIYNNKVHIQTLYTISKNKGYNDIKIIENDGQYNIEYSKDIDDTIIEIKELSKENRYVYDIETEIGRFHCGIGELIVKNTDSIFLKFKNNDLNVKGKQAILPTIAKAKELTNEYNKLLKWPQNIEYEKIYYPFIIFSKKRYVANKYENDDTNYKLSYMGIALKRRDNANIVKIIFGGVLDIILNKQDIEESIEFLKKSLSDLIDEKYDINELVITKSLKSTYKDPSKIAHKVLSMRMVQRDPGMNIQSNDRIRYIYIKKKETSKKLLQGDMIEDVDYVKKNNLKPDYEFYITNQIMKPICQLYSLVLEDLKEYKKSKDYFIKMEKTVLETKNGNKEKTKERIDTLREREVHDLLFKSFINKANIKANSAQLITNYFSIKKK